jgi:hypothetical protein
MPNVKGADTTWVGDQAAAWTLYAETIELEESYDFPGLLSVQRVEYGRVVEIKLITRHACD